MNRGTAKTMVFRTDRDRRSFLGLLGELTDDGLWVLAYALMGNHYHLAVWSGEGRLSQGMRQLDGSYARLFNARHGRDGALFKGRFCSKPITSQRQLERTGIYIHNNPVEGGLVERSLDYRWTSLRQYAKGTTTVPWLRLDLLAGRTGDAYLEMIDAHAPEIRSLSTDVEDLGASWVDDGDAEADRAIAASDTAVADWFSVSVDALYSLSRGRLNLPRMIAITLAAQSTGLRPADVATRYGLRGPSGVRAARRRLLALAETDGQVRSAVTELGLDLHEG